MMPALHSGFSRTGVVVYARHPSSAKARGPHHAKQNAKKKRDISTSFRKGPVPQPLVTTGQLVSQDEREVIIGIPPPAAKGVTTASTAAPVGLPTHQQALFSQADTEWLSMDEPYRVSRALSEPVVAVAALDVALAVDSPAVTTAGSTEAGESLLWAEADPLASFDRVLDGLLVAAPLPQGFAPAKAPSPSPDRDLLTSSSLLGEAQNSSADAALPATSTSSTGPRPVSNGKPSARPTKTYAQAMAAAAAAPAVTVIHCETEFERELEAAAALQQVLVVKVESSQHLLQGGLDSALRFQTHTNLPTQLNTYMQHNELSQGYTLQGSASSSTSSTSGTAELLASMGIALGSPAASSSSSSSMGAAPGALFGSSSTAGEPFSPVHAWYKQVASQYAHSAAAEGRHSPVRFLSLQADSPRSRAVCRRLGVSSPLAVVLLDAASGRKLQEVCGQKIEQELPNGLMYFGGCDAEGRRPAELLQTVSTQAELEAAKSSSQLTVAAFHVHAAPPCIRSFARMHSVARSHSAAAAGGPSVSFAVMDVDTAAEGSAVSNTLGLQHLPTYVIYRGSEEVARLSSSPDRRRLGDVLAQQLAALASSQDQ